MAPPILCAKLAAPVTKPRMPAAYLAIIVFKYAKLAAFLVLGAAALRIARLPPESLAEEAAGLLGAHRATLSPEASPPRSRY